MLVDCGGEYNGYASDITRTWPVNGRFSDAQKELYQAVLNVNKKCIKLCTESSNLSLHGIHSESVRFMKEELEEIGFNVTGWVSTLSKEDNILTLYRIWKGYFILIMLGITWA